MAVFAYKAVNGGQSTVSGVLVAESPRQARETLRARGLTIQQIVRQGAEEPAKTAIVTIPKAKPESPRRGISSRQAARVASVVREWSTLLGAGIPLLDAIDTVSRQYRGAFRTSLAMLRDRIASGVSLADAMRQQPDVFDDLSVHMVEVGEQSGSLEPVLDRLADFKERSLRLKNRVLTALAYPCFVLAMAIAVSVGLMTFVIPRLLDSLLESGRPLPWATQLVKACSDLLINQWWLLPLVIGAGVALTTVLLRVSRVRLAWHRLKLRVPVLGPMMQKQMIARLSMVIATMMRSGVVFLKALEIGRRATPNLAMRRALEACEEAVRNGRDISDALAVGGEFPPVVVQIFGVGQQSGRLEEMLERLSADYDQQVTLMSERLTALLEPVLVLFLVGVVGLIALATILPMLEAADVL